jgi:iron complex outermembrane receptor protein
MMKSKYLIAFFVINYILSASEFSGADTLKVYHLGEIEISGNKSRLAKIEKASMAEVPYHIIQNSDVSSLSELQHYIPSASIRTNSRGESMLFVRGAGERQLGLFFDGAAMNIPWDNRLDLTFVPADIIGNIRINKSANSMFYGPNIMGGAVSIATVERENPGFGLTMKMQFAEGNSQNYSLLHDGRIGKFNYLVNISYYSTDGFIMSSKAPSNLANQNNNSSIRSNTDQNRLNTYFRGEYQFSDNAKIGLSMSTTNQEKGVAPETYAGTDARFWRFPERNRTLITLNGEFRLLDNLTLKSTLWQDEYDQQIDSYKSFAYDWLEEMQIEKDRTLGTRILLNYKISDNQSLAYVFNGFTTSHKQKNEDAILVLYPFITYSQNTLGTGLEYKALLRNIDINAGLGFDFNQTPETGRFVEAKNQSQSDLAGFLTLKYLLTDEIAFTVSSSRSTRFPTMREQYDGALGEFKTNPDLKPETGLLNEAGIIFSFDKFSGKAVGFYNNYDGLIERIRLTNEQDSLRRRMRVNLGNAVISGIDINFTYFPISKLSLEGFFTFMNSKAESDGKEFEHLIQKPEIVAGFLSSYKFDFGLKPQFEVEYNGKMYDIDPETDGGFLALDPSLLLNLRLSYGKNFSTHLFAEMFVRVNNITDEYKLSQWGLPAPGRTLSAGIMVRI